MNKGPKVDHSEIPVSDLAMAKAFYEQVFQVTLQHAALANGMTMDRFSGKSLTGNGAHCHHPAHYFRGEQGPMP